MSKKVSSIMLVILLISSITLSTYAAKNNVDSIKEDTTREETMDTETIEVEDSILYLSLEDSITYALDNSREMKIQDLNIAKNNYSYEEAMDGVKSFDDLEKNLIKLPSYISVDIFHKSGISLVDRKLFSLGVMERQAKLSVNINSWNKTIKENEIKYNVEKAYFDTVQTSKQVEIAKENYELTKKQYDQSIKMYELGTISKQDLLSLEVALTQSQSGYETAKMGYQMQQMNFNNTLGLPLDQKINLTDDIVIKEYESFNLEDTIDKSLENNGILKVLRETHTLQQLTLDAIASKYTSNTDRYKEQEIAVEKAKHNLEITERQIEMGVRAAYLNLEIAKKQITAFEKAVEKSEMALDLAEKSYELGHSTITQVNQARLGLMNSKTELVKQIHSYNMALLNFKYSTGLGKTQIPFGGNQGM